MCRADARARAAARRAQLALPARRNRSHRRGGRHAGVCGGAHARARSPSAAPAESVTAAKRGRLIAAARLYLSRRPRGELPLRRLPGRRPGRATSSGSATPLASSARSLLLSITVAGGALAQDASGGVRCSCRARRSPAFATTPPRRSGRSCASATRSALEREPDNPHDRQRDQPCLARSQARLCAAGATMPRSRGASTAARRCRRASAASRRIRIPARRIEFEVLRRVTV